MAQQHPQTRQSLVLSPRSITIARGIWKAQIPISVFLIGNVGAKVVVQVLSSPPDTWKQALIVMIGHYLESLVIHNIGMSVAIIGCIAFFELSVYLISHAQPPSSSPSTPNFSWLKAHWKAFTILVSIAALIIGIVFGTIVPTSSIHTHSPDQYSTTQIDGENVGLCDGRCAFDFDRLNGQKKEEAVKYFTTGQPQCNNDYWNWKDDSHALIADPYWDWAANEDKSDAEAKIYVEDQCILGMPHRTLVIAVPLSGNQHDLNLGRDMLQGAYISQHEYNQAHNASNGPFISLLIANIGSLTMNDASSAQQTVANQVIAAASADPTLVGVMGLPFGSDAFISTLNRTDAPVHLPMVSVAPSQDTQTPHLVSVAPSLANEAFTAARYIQKTQSDVQHVSVIYSDNTRYSQVLKDAFVQAFPLSENDTFSYTTGTYSLQDAVKQAIIDNADLIYFTGPFEDLPPLQLALQQYSPNKQIKLFSGDSMYQWVHGDPGNSHYFYGLLYTAFAYPDEWSIQRTKQPPLIQDFKSAYDPGATPTGNPYAYERTDSDALLSYDAMSILAKASLQGQGDTTPDLVWKGLQTTDCQGASGHISFEQGSSIPDNKAVLVISIREDSKQHGQQSLHFSGNRVPGGQYITNTGNKGDVSTCFPN